MYNNKSENEKNSSIEKITSPCDVMVSSYCTLKAKDKITMILRRNNNSSVLNNLLLVNVIKWTYLPPISTI